MPKVKETRLRKGDTIKCADAEDCVRTRNELESCCIETDFLYEKDGESGLWLEITKETLEECFDLLEVE